MFDLSAYTLYYVCMHVVHRVPKKEATKLLAITFSFCFTGKVHQINLNCISKVKPSGFSGFSQPTASLSYHPTASAKTQTENYSEHNVIIR